MNAQIMAVTISTSGYCTEMGLPQPRHRARRISQESTGTLSYQAISLPHFGQRERGRTTDSFGSAPHRTMHTLRKLPITAPNPAAIATRSVRSSASSALTLHLVEKNSRRHGDVERLGPGREGNGHPPRGSRGERRAHTGPFVANDEADGRAGTRAGEQRADRCSLRRGRPRL